MDEPVQRFPGGMTAPEQWLDLLAPKLPNLPPDMIKHEVLGILRDFCKRGGVWRDWLKPFAVSGVPREYGLETGNPGDEVAGVLQILRYDTGLALAPVPPELGRPLELIPVTGRPERYWQTQPDRVFFEPLPAGTDYALVAAYVTLAPLDECAVPQWFLSEHQYAVVDGVLANLLRIPGPNYRPSDAGVHRTLYISARDRARTRSLAGSNRAAALIRPPHFARGSQR
jgi:hypothetical protein